MMTKKQKIQKLEQAKKWLIDDHSFRDGVCNALFRQDDPVRMYLFWQTVKYLPPKRYDFQNERGSVFCWKRNERGNAARLRFLDRMIEKVKLGEL